MQVLNWPDARLDAFSAGNGADETCRESPAAQKFKGIWSILEKWPCGNGREACLSLRSRHAVLSACLFITSRVGFAHHNALRHAPTSSVSLTEVTAAVCIRRSERHNFCQLLRPTASLFRLKPALKAAQLLAVAPVLTSNESSTSKFSASILLRAGCQVCEGSLGLADMLLLHSRRLGGPSVASIAALRRRGCP